MRKILDSFITYLCQTARHAPLTLRNLVEVSFTTPKVMWTLIINLPHTEGKFYPEVKSQTGLSSLPVSCKRALMLISKKSYPIVYLYILEKLSYVADFFYDNVFYTLYFFNCSTLFFIKLFFFEKLKTYLKGCFYIIL